MTSPLQQLLLHLAQRYQQPKIQACHQSSVVPQLLPHPPALAVPTALHKNRRHHVCCGSTLVTLSLHSWIAIWTTSPCHACEPSMLQSVLLPLLQVAAPMRPPWLLRRPQLLQLPPLLLPQPLQGSLTVAW